MVDLRVDTVLHCYSKKKIFFTVEVVIDRYIKVIGLDEVVF